MHDSFGKPLNVQTWGLAGGQKPGYSHDPNTACSSIALADATARERETCCKAFPWEIGYPDLHICYKPPPCATDRTAGAAEVGASERKTLEKVEQIERATRNPEDCSYCTNMELPAPQHLL